LLCHNFTDEADRTVLAGWEVAFVKEMAKFGEEYAMIVRDDYRLFIDALRKHRFPDQ